MLAEALEARQEAARRLRDTMADREAWMPSEPSHGLAVATKTTQTVPASLDTGATPEANDTARPTVPAAARKRRIGAGTPDTSTVNTVPGRDASESR
jgi:hypothetical protein